MEFKAYRNTLPQPIHIGGIEPPAAIQIDELIEYNGLQVKRMSGEVIPLPNPRTITAAIKAGWLQEEGQPEAPIQPARGVQVREALPRGVKRERINIEAVREEDQEVGTISSVRATARQGERSASKKGPRGFEVVGDVSSNEGAEVAGTLRNPTKRKILVGEGSSERELIDELKQEGQQWAPVKKPRDNGTWGAGDKPRAVVSGHQEFEQPTARVGSGSSSVGGMDAGREVARIGRPARQEEVEIEFDSEEPSPWSNLTQAEIEAVLTRAADTKRAAAQKALEEERKRKAALAAEQAAELEALAASLLQEPVDNGEIEWDLTPHWATRVKTALELYGDNIDALEQICAMERPGAVRAKLEDRIAELSK